MRVRRCPRWTCCACTWRWGEATVGSAHVRRGGRQAWGGAGASGPRQELSAHGVATRAYHAGLPAAATAVVQAQCGRHKHAGWRACLGTMWRAALRASTEVQRF